MKRSKFKLVRRGQKWVVRARVINVIGLAESNAHVNCFKVKPIKLDADVLPTSWKYTDLEKLRKWDYDFWFHSKGEAVMFMLKCE